MRNLSGSWRTKYESLAFSVIIESESGGAREVRAAPVLAGMRKKKIGPWEEKGERWIMIAHAFFCWRSRLRSLWHTLSKPPPSSPLFPTSLWWVPVKSDIPLCPSKNNQHSAAGCQGSSLPYNRRARWGNQKLSNVKCPLLRLRVRYVFASPTPEPWLQCRCTNSLFINRDH